MLTQHVLPTLHASRDVLAGGISAIIPPGEHHPHPEKSKEKAATK